MKIATVIARTLLGAGFIVFGLNILFPFLPQPPFPENSLPMQFMMIAGPTGWMKIVGVFQILGGALVAFGGTAPLGLLILAPILVNILIFHALLMGGEGLAPGVVFSALELFLMYAYRKHYASILMTDAKPSL